MSVPKSSSSANVARLLVPVRGLSGTVYPPGTPVRLGGRGATVDAFVKGDWLPLHWWEFAPGEATESPPG